MRLIFRDIADAQVQIEGCNVEFCQEGIRLNVDVSTGTAVTLTGFTAAQNPPKAQLRTDLMTRVQGEVVWKNAVLGNEKKMPRSIREALAELDSLEY